MKKNYTVLFLMLFVVSIAGGLALSNTFKYAMLIAVGIGTVFLVCSTFFAAKNYNSSKIQ